MFEEVPNRSVDPPRPFLPAPLPARLRLKSSLVTALAGEGSDSPSWTDVIVPLASRALDDGALSAAGYSAADETPGEALRAIEWVVKLHFTILKPNATINGW